MEAKSFISNSRGHVSTVEITQVGWIGKGEETHPFSLDFQISQIGELSLLVEDDGFVYLENLDIGGKICLGSIYTGVANDLGK